MPQERDLPASLASMAYRNGIAVPGDPYFHQDMDLLIRRLDSLFTSVQPDPPPLVRTPEPPRQPVGLQPITLPA